MRQGEKHLSNADEIMAQLVSNYGRCPLAQREFRPFDTLVRSIISQQLSAKAADAIEARVAQVVSIPFKPDHFLSVSLDTLRSAGLSVAKARYILELAARVTDGRLNFADLLNSPDESVIASLTAIAGVGRWTAEMFLIFGLRRLDVLALGDAGLRRAANMLYQNSDEGNGLLEQVSHPWRPYRSIASWYLWKHLDVVGKPTKTTP